MNSKQLEAHLDRVGIRLSPCREQGFRWKTGPSSGYPFPTDHFSTLRQLEAHWKKVISRRLAEETMAKSAWAKAQPGNEQDLLVAWARGEVVQIPEVLLTEMEQRPSLSGRGWTGKAEALASRYGCAAFSWFHEAVLDAAGIDLDPDEPLP